MTIWECVLSFSVTFLELREKSLGSLQEILLLAQSRICDKDDDEKMFFVVKHKFNVFPYVVQYGTTCKSDDDNNIVYGPSEDFAP